MEHLAIAILAIHGWGGVAAVLGVLALGVTLTYTGTALDAKDNLGGSFGAYVDQELAGLQVVAAAGPTAIANTHGKVVVTYAGVAALTLANPTAGSPANGGNDGQTLKIIDGSGHAHTVTTGANGINTTHHIATSGAAIGDSIELIAYNGAWYCNPAGTNWTIS